MSVRIVTGGCPNCAWGGTYTDLWHAHLAASEHNKTCTEAMKLRVRAAEAKR